MSNVVSVMLWVHVVFGALAVMSGSLSMVVRKGGHMHMRAGQVVVLSRILSSLLGAVIGAMKYETLLITAQAGVLATTLLLSGLRIVRSRTFTHFGCVALCAVSALNTVGLFVCAGIALASLDGVLFGFGSAEYLFLATIASAALFADVRQLRGRVRTFHHRIAAHLWRMCIGFFIAVGSAFTGPGSAAFPDALRTSGLLSLPEMLVIGAMLVWLTRTLFSKSWRNARSLSNPLNQEEI